MLFEASNCLKEVHSLSNVLQKIFGKESTNSLFCLDGKCIVLPGRIVILIIAVTKVLPFQIVSLKLEIDRIIFVEKMGRVDCKPVTYNM
jgi:hypothetical protein